MGENHHHVSAKTIEGQIEYIKSPHALETAKAIVRTKLRNCQFLLTDYRQARRRFFSDQAEIIEASQRKLYQISFNIEKIQERPRLFRLEGRAARVYWRAVSVLCRQSDWKRIYPHARDSLNIAFNTGYTILGRRCLEAIIKAGLLPELGILHGKSAKDGLVYDLMECFRQTAVDAVVIPFFSRKRKKGFFAELQNQYQKKFLCRGRCEQLEQIIFLEALKLRKAILSREVWLPYKHRWGHSAGCK